MPQYPLSRTAYECPKCFGVFTIKWIHPWSLDEYDTSQVPCPYCHEQTPLRALREVGSVPTRISEEDRVVHPIAKLIKREASYPKRHEAKESRLVPHENDVETAEKKPEKIDLEKRGTKIEATVCEPLMEAATLELYQKNIFRVTGLSVDATSKEISRHAQKLQMMEEMGGVQITQPAFSLVSPPTPEQIRGALARMKEPENRLVDEFFWFWPERFGESRNDPGIQAVLAGETQKAMEIWLALEREGSVTARHNLAIMYHMSALDWTNHQLDSGYSDEGRGEKIVGYWRDAFDRWEDLADSDQLWDVLKKRVRSLDDEALTIGFVRRMRRLLPQAFDKINAEAALRFAESGWMHSAAFHVDFMRQTNEGLDDVEKTAEMVLAPTKKRVEHRLRSAEEKTLKHPETGVEVAFDLIRQCKPLMALFDLFHGQDHYHRSDLFDDVANTVAEAVIGYQIATGDNNAFVEALEQALPFATGMQIREKLIRNISIGKDNLAWQHLEPLFETIRQITEGNKTPSGKLLHIQHEIFPKLPNLATRLGSKSSSYLELMDTIAIALRGLSIAAHNESRDFPTAEKCIGLAFQFVHNPDLKSRIQDDIKALKESKNEYKCCVCNVNQADPQAVLRMPLSKLPAHLLTELSAADKARGWIEVPRCPSCKTKQSATPVGGGSGCLIALLAPLGFLCLALIGSLVARL